jgi:hypothetical protein
MIVWLLALLSDPLLLLEGQSVGTRRFPPSLISRIKRLISADRGELFIINMCSISSHYIYSFLSLLCRILLISTLSGRRELSM